MKKKTSFLLWLLAFILTLILAIYQRLSGPTYPVRGSETVAGMSLKYKFYRSWTSYQPLPVLLAVPGGGLSLRLHYRRFPLLAEDAWAVLAMKYAHGWYQAWIPGQPAAGKVAYKVEVLAADGSRWLNNGRPIVARFKGEVPAWLLILHIVFMFAAMMLAFRAGLEALRPGGSWQKFIPWTLAVTALGGLILGPLVQKYAFGAYWTGFPVGSDLTDTKILFVFFFWLAAFFLRRRSRWWTVAATLLMVAVYMIPHSVLGSELDYKTGKVGTTKNFSD